MAINPRRKSDAARRANQVIRSRTVLVMVLLGVCTFVALFWKLYDLQIRQHEDLQEQDGIVSRPDNGKRISRWSNRIRQYPRQPYLRPHSVRLFLRGKI